MPVFDKFDFTTLNADGKLMRYVQVKPGDYDVFLAIKDKGTVEKIDKNYTPRVGLLKKELTVPDYNAAGLQTSSMLVATGIQPAPAGQTADNDPYIFGQMQIVPSTDGKYKKTDKQADGLVVLVVNTDAPRIITISGEVTNGALPVALHSQGGPGA